MSIITLRETASTDNGFNAKLILNNKEYSVNLCDPFTEAQEAGLQWYYESWLRWPMVDLNKAEAIKGSVKEYGVNLFEQVFKSDFDAYSDYKKLRENLPDLSVIILSQSSGFQGLHWEAIQDPELPRPLAVEVQMIRQGVNKGTALPTLPESPTINLLVVTARPNEDKDVAYRTISRPLIELIDEGNLRINAEILRPGTYESLVRHLEEKGNQAYHIVHFDLHGGLMTYEQFKEGVDKNRYFYQRGYGLNDLAEYQGERGFLFFETDIAGKANPVEASEIATLLQNRGIPICILNACQSGKSPTVESSLDDEERSPLTPLKKGGTSTQTSDDNNNGGIYRESSLGNRLMEAGIQVVVAMGYSITVTAAKVMMTELYKQLFDGKPLLESIRLSRLELYNNKVRKGWFNYEIDLEDWLLPIVYQGGEVNFQLRELNAEEEEAYYEALETEYRFPLPTYRFIGRDLEILKIEKSLLKHNLLLLQGMGGTGKTTLLNYLREWWTRTGYAAKIFYFGYDLKAWTLEQILFEMGKQLYKKFEFAKFQAMGETAQRGKMVDTLRVSQPIIILDNMESVTGQPLAIQNTLDEGEQNKLKGFLERLKGTKVKVIVGSRSNEEWLGDLFTKDNIRYRYPLQGLDVESRSELGDKILTATIGNEDKETEIKNSDGFKRLMKILAGYPLAMEVVLGNLRQQTPTQILEGLTEANLQDVGEGDKTQNIVKCVEYSHSNLSADAQRLLLCLAPFSGFLFRDALGEYGKQLQKLDPFKDYPFELFETAIDEAIGWGLLSPIDSPQPPRMGESSPLLNIQPVFPYFLKMKVKECDSATQDGLKEGFKNHYLGLGKSYYGLMKSKNPQERQLGIFFCQLEYENLYHGLEICLEKQESILTLFVCLDNYFDLTSDVQSKLKLSQRVMTGLDNYPSEAKQGQIALEIIGILDVIGTGFSKTQNYQLAKETHEKAKDLLMGITDIDEAFKQTGLAGMYHRLGMVSQELREWEQAKSYYQTALQIKVEYSDRFSQASTYGQLGILSQELREWEQAKSYYQTALQIYVEYSDRFSQAKTYHNLGVVSQELREWEEAKSYYQTALQIFVEYSDRFSQASIYHQLGMVSQELREWEQAKSYYQTALQIKVEYGDRYSQASTYHQLGRVAEELREWEQAKSYYQTALQIFVEYSDRFSQASTYHQLGSVAEELREWEEAKSYYQTALQIKVEYGDRYSQASTYHNLGNVAKAEGNQGDALNYYLQALQILVAYQDSYMIETFSLPALLGLYQETEDVSILEGVASVLGVSVESLNQDLQD
ncbi:MAG: tetratricopeptide repeat protein [Microcystaceae cyanobacterium]